MSIIDRLFGQKPVAKPEPVAAPIEMVGLAYHRSVVEGLRADNEALRQASYAADRRAESEKARAITKGRLAAELLTERDAARETLRRIAAMETPGAAFIGRKMAATARAGLPEFADGEREAA